MKGTFLKVVTVSLIFFGVFLYDYSGNISYIRQYYNPVVDRREVSAAYWAAENLLSGKDVVYAADLFASEMLMTVTTNPAVIGGDWALVTAEELWRFMDLQDIFLSSNANLAHELCKKWGVKYVFLSSRMIKSSYFGYGWVSIPKPGVDKFFIDHQYFRPVYNMTTPAYGDEGVWILEVLD
jgi:hypothetical protein